MYFLDLHSEYMRPGVARSGQVIVNWGQLGKSQFNMALRALLFTCLLATAMAGQVIYYSILYKPWISNHRNTMRATVTNPKGSVEKLSPLSPLSAHVERFSVSSMRNLFHSWPSQWEILYIFFKIPLEGKETLNSWIFPKLTKAFTNRSKFQRSD